MKKTFLAVLMAGSSIAMFAQTTPTTTPTPPATEPTTTPTTTTSPTDPMNTTTTPNLSTSWAPGTSPYWGWNSYGLWNTSLYPTTNASSSTSMNTGNLSSTGNYSAYGTSVAALPPNVQMNFSRDFPASANQAYSWNQYGDWFHTQYLSNGRSTHYYYDTRGNGYSLALPVIQTYVPEDVIDKALQKYGANLYSISMVKTSGGTNAYQLGLIERGQLRMEYLNEDGTSATNVWRTEEITTTDANAAMDSQNTMSSTTITTSPEVAASDEKETKTEWKENGVKTKIKSGDGKVKIKQKKVDD